MQTYRTLFARSEFRALWLGYALDNVAATMSSLALGTLIGTETGSAALTSLAMFGPALARLLGAWTLNSAADAVPPRPVLVISGTVTATALLVQVLPLEPLWRVAVTLVAAAIAAVGAGGRWGLVGDLVPAEQRTFARATMNLADGSFQVVGFAASGLLLQLLDARTIFLLSAAVACASVAVSRFGLRSRPARSESGLGLRQTWRTNRALLADRSTRTLLIALCVPNGLIAGCEALFVPLARRDAGILLASAAGGMLLGDLIVGRFLDPAHRRRAGTPLRLLLAAPFLLFGLPLPLPIAAVVTAIATIGYAASLQQQEALTALSAPERRGQALGAESALRTAAQGLFAMLAGVTADLLSPPLAIVLLAAMSLLISLQQTRALRHATAKAAALAAVPAPGRPSG